MNVNYHSTFNFSGGTLALTNLYNQPTSTVNLSGQGTRTIPGAVWNYGTFNATNTTVDFTGTLKNFGAYKHFPNKERIILNYGE